MANPKLRFKAADGTEYPEWGSTTLNKQGVFIRGLSYKKQNVVDDHTKTLVLRSSNILQFGKLDYLNKCQFVNKQPLPNQILQKGDIVICMANGSAHLVGKASCYEGGYQTGNLTVGAFCSIYRQHTFPIAKYIFQTQSYLNFISENSQGGNGAISNIKPSTYEDFECSYPCLEEQRKIADFLSTFDDKVEAKEQQLEALQETKKGLLQQIFSQQLRFKADDGTEFPDWKQYKLGNLGSFKKGKGLSKDQLSEEGTPCILYGQLYTDYSEVIKSVVSKTNASLDNAVFSEGNEVLLPCSGETSLDISRATFLPIKGVALGGDLHVITCNSNINGSLLSYIINSSLKKEIARIAQGATVVHTSASSLSKILVNYPSSLEEQRKIAEFLGAFDEKIEAVKRQLEALKEIKKGLLQQMFV